MPFLPTPALKPGAPVRVVAPAGPFEQDRYDRGLSVISERYRPEARDDISARLRYLAGDDSRRVQELWQALIDDSQGVFAARGGYGVLRILDQLALDRFKPKPVVGFSDLTALHCALQCRGFISIHAPVLTQLGAQPRRIQERLFALLEGAIPEPLVGDEAIVPGVAEGPLLGGNLSVLTRLIGTKFFPDMNGAVLVLEDVTERPYRIDRMWQHLRLAGVFEEVSGIALGDFTECEEKGADYTSRDLLRELAQRTNVPTVAGFLVGHGEVNEPIPLGARVRLDTASRSLTFLEPATR